MDLILYFTTDVSLQTWDGLGLLEREVSFYRALLPKVGGVRFVTYGGRRDLRYARELEGIRVVCNKWNLPQDWYVRFVSRVYPRFWPKGAVIKSNQVPGSDLALKAARCSGNPFIARCGYLPSRIAQVRHDISPTEVERAQDLEKRVFRAADRVVVTTPSMQRTVIDEYGVDSTKVRVIPNYVDVKNFRPSGRPGVPDSLCYVGRLEPEKNVDSLVQAVGGLGFQIDMIGGGSLKEHLAAQVKAKGFSIRFLGNVRHGHIPSHLNRASAFILTSHIEHHPKALLEAMACGLPVIGTDVSGIRELIEHGRTGFLCDPSTGSIQNAIAEVMANPALRARLGKNARQFVVENFALEKIIDMELALLKELAP